MSGLHGVSPSAGGSSSVGGPGEPKAVGPLAHLAAGPTPSQRPPPVPGGGGHIAHGGSVDLSQLYSAIGKGDVSGVERVVRTGGRDEASQALNGLEVMANSPGSGPAALQSLKSLVRDGGPQAKGAVKVLENLAFSTRDEQLSSSAKEAIAELRSEGLGVALGRPLVEQKSSPGVVNVYETAAQGNVPGLLVAAQGRGVVSEAAIKCLALMVTTPEAYTARPALDALRFLIEAGGPQGQMALSQLADNFKSLNPEVRSMVENTLGHYVSEAVDEIFIARGDPQPFEFLASQRKHTAQAVFGHLVSSRAPVPESCKPSIANFMAFLVVGGGAEAGPALDYLARLADSSPEAAKAVILYAPLMASAGGPFAERTMNILEHLANHPDGSVARKAVETIGEIAAGPRGAPEPLLVMTPPKARAKATPPGGASSSAVGDLPSAKVPPTTVPPGDVGTSVGVGR